MPTNIEIKAQACDWEMQIIQAKALADSTERLVQLDIFFNAPRGKLKLRMFGNGAGELIGYERDSGTGPRPSNYMISHVADPDTMRVLLANVLGETAQVSKRRTVFLVGQTRVHFDRVDNLGKFIELEVVMAEGQSEQEGRQIADGLVRQLGIRPEDLLEESYVDLLAKRG